MVDTDQISTRADEPGLVIRNEDVFIEKVRERVALAEATGHLLSPVLLLQTGARRRAARGARGGDAPRPARPPPPTSTTAGRTPRDLAGRRPARTRTGCCALAGGGELVVADGNHRSLAAQTGGLPRFLAVVTTPASVAIQPYNRLVSELTAAAADLLDRLAAAGARRSSRSTAPVESRPPAARCTCTRADGLRGDACPRPRRRAVVDNLDHALVERVLLRDALGLDPGDKRITYVGGDYPASWLHGEVDARPGRAGRPDRAGDRGRLRRGQPGPAEDAPQEHLVHPEGARRSGRRRAAALSRPHAVRRRWGRPPRDAADARRLTDCPVCASTWDPTTPATS